MLIFVILFTIGITCTVIKPLTEQSKKTEVVREKGGNGGNK